MAATTTYVFGDRSYSTFEEMTARMHVVRDAIARSKRYYDTICERAHDAGFRKLYRDNAFDDLCGLDYLMLVYCATIRFEVDIAVPDWQNSYKEMLPTYAACASEEWKRKGEPLAIELGFLPLPCKTETHAEPMGHRAEVTIRVLIRCIKPLSFEAQRDHALFEIVDRTWAKRATE